MGNLLRLPFAFLFVLDSVWKLENNYCSEALRELFDLFEFNFSESKELKGFERFLIFGNLCGFFVIVSVWFCLDVWPKYTSHSVDSGSIPIKNYKLVQ
jgi:hypothetical protein